MQAFQVVTCLKGWGALLYRNVNFHRMKSGLKLTIDQKLGCAILRDRAYKRDYSTSLSGFSAGIPQGIQPCGIPVLKLLNETVSQDTIAIGPCLYSTNMIFF